MGVFSLWSHTGGSAGKAFWKVLWEAQGFSWPRVLGSMTSFIIFPVWKQSWPPEHGPMWGTLKVGKTPLTWLDVESELR